MGRSSQTHRHQPPNTAGIPSPAFTCDMRGNTHTALATHLVDAKVHIGVDDYEPLSWLVCSDLVCLLGATAHAEAIGIHVDTRLLTVAEAENITGLQAGAA